MSAQRNPVEDVYDYDDYMANLMDHLKYEAECRRKRRRRKDHVRRWGTMLTFFALVALLIVGGAALAVAVWRLS